MSMKFSEDLVPLTDLKANPGRVVQARYAKQGVPDVGARLAEDVFQRVQALADHADMGRVVPEFDQPFLRELIHPPFRIVYRHDPERVRVVRVWRSERLLRLPAAD